MRATKKSAPHRRPPTLADDRQSARLPASDVTLRLTYEEASLLVVGANLAMGLGIRPDADDEALAMTAAAGSIVDKLYRAEPRLKRDARRVEGEMRSFFAQTPASDDSDTQCDGDPVDSDTGLRGERWLPMVVDSMAANQELTLRKGGRGGRERHLRPLGAGQIGGIAVAIGWSSDVMDYTIVRLDDIGAIRRTGATFQHADGEAFEACIERFTPQPRRGSA
jgi:hypothetical protein